MEIGPRSLKALWFSFGLAAAVLAVFLAGGQATKAVWWKNGPVEVLSALGYLVGLVLATAGCARTSGPGRWHLAIWAAICFMCFGEETSWLQNLLGYATPGFIARHSAQGEFNLHNLDVFQGGAFAGAAGDGSLPGRLLKSQHLFQLGFLTYFLVLPLMVCAAAIRRLAVRLSVPYPDWQFVLCAWIPIGFSGALTLFSSADTKVAIAELREMCYAATIAGFVALLVVRAAQRRSR